MFKYALSAFAGLAAAALLASGATAGTINMSFDTDPVLSPTQAPGTWYTDRYAPAGFSSQFFMGDNRLALELSAADGATGRPAAFSSGFYNTQGRKFDLNVATSIGIDMYIDAAFGSLAPGERVGGIWGTAVDAVNAITAYPIIEFFDSQFQVWDVTNGGWLASGTPTTFAYNQFTTLQIVLDAALNQFTFFANGELLQTMGADGSKFIANVILQGINTNDGINRTLYFDNFTATVPVPAALPLFGTALGAFGLYGWNRRRRRTPVAA